MEILIGVLLAAAVALVGLIIWLSRARTRATRAEAAAGALVRAEELNREADRIMEEPVADEAAWLDAARERAGRVQDDSRRP